MWRLIVDPPGEPAANMALDLALLWAVRAGVSPPTIRVYRWSCPAVSVGFFQNVARTLNVPFLASAGIPVVRRPTGGRGVLHGGDITVSVVVPAERLGSDSHSVARSHARIMTGIAAGLARLGHAACLGSQRTERDASAGDCFAVAGRSDLIDPAGVKLAGGAQRRLGSTILQQVSVPWKAEGPAHRDVFLGAVVEPYYLLADHCLDTLQEAIIGGLCAGLQCTSVPGDYTHAERDASLTALDGLLVDLTGFM